LRDEPLGGREPPQGGEVKLTDSSTKADLLRRVRRIEGQARGVARMIEEDRDCREVLQQLAAVRSAAHQATVALVRAYATECMVSDGSPEEIADALAVALSRLA
jgi:DNA-binding FrmR family transcriptional regulator